MIVSDLEKRLNPDEYTTVNSFLGNRSYKFNCLKSDKLRLEKVILMIERLFSKFKFKHSGGSDEWILMSCIISVLSSEDRPELQDKNDLKQKKIKPSLFGELKEDEVDRVGDILNQIKAELE